MVGRITNFPNEEADPHHYSDGGHSTTNPDQIHVINHEDVTYVIHHDSPTQHFTDLDDAPPSYAGAGGLYVRVKADGTGLEFVPVTGAVTNFLSLTDTPDSYAPFGGMTIRVKADGTGLEFVPYQTVQQDYYIVQVAYNANNKVEYVGKAAPNSTTDNPVWSISKLFWNIDLTFSHLLRADGNKEFDNIWVNREAYSYS